MSEAVLPAGWPAMSIAQAHALITAPGSPAEMETVDIRGVPTRTWKNLPPSLRSIVELGRTHGEKAFLVYEDERVTYEAFYRAVSALARQLQADGVQKGDRVAVIMRNLPEWVVSFYAAASLGAIVTPLNAWWTGPELEYGLTDSGSKVVLMDAERGGVDLDAQIAGADLVITAEGSVDYQTPRGKIPAEVARRAKLAGKPVLALAGSIGRGAEDVYGVGIDAVIGIIPVPMELSEAVARADELLSAATERALRLILLGSAMAAA